MLRAVRVGLPVKGLRTSVMGRKVLLLRADLSDAELEKGVRPFLDSEGDYRGEVLLSSSFAHISFPNNQKCSPIGTPTGGKADQGTHIGHQGKRLWAWPYFWVPCSFSNSFLMPPKILTLKWYDHLVTFLTGLGTTRTD
jgi:hypothetical protein